MKIHEYMKNPAGKGAVIPGKDMFIQNFDYRFQVLSKDKEFELNIYTQGQDVFYHILVPSESPYRENKYDVILLDIMMPEMNGEETLVELKKIQGFNTPVIAVTADALEGAKEKYLKEGFDQYVVKPFSRDQIKEKLDRVFTKDSK